MSCNVAIQVERLSKCYQIYAQPRDRLKQFLMPRLQRMAGRQPKQYFREFRALHDLSFEVNKGETFGIIGRNGSGKSTLLQMICGTLNPTGGSIQTRGRIAALLELGAGFNPEFTGRENVYMNAAVLGLQTAEIDARFDAIAAFADIGPFIEQPVKTYSSGMYVRLAFAVAINVAPDVLIVDEALAVGDEPFQRKCYARIERIKDNGATILLVTHAASTITQMCSRALLLDHGCRLFLGNPKVAVESYYRLIYSSDAEKENIQRDLKLKDLEASREVTSKGPPAQEASVMQINPAYATTAMADVAEPIGSAMERHDPGLKPLSTMHYASMGAHIEHIRIENKDGRQVNVLAPQETYWYRYDVRFHRTAQHVHFGMLIKTTTGNDLAAIGSHPFGKSIAMIPEGAVCTVRFPFINVFSPGTYFVNAGCSGSLQGHDTFLHRVIDAIAFRVEQSQTGLRYAGAIQVAAGTPEIHLVTA